MDKYEQSKEFFDGYIEDYADSIIAIQPEFYKNTAVLLNRALKGCECVLDIGNGGVINYDYTPIKELHCADLSVSTKAIEKYKADTNIRFMSGDIMNLENIEDNTYDAVIVQTVIHHLAGGNLACTRENVLKALAECMRVLKPGGKLLIVESTVSRGFEKVERAFYGLMQLFFKLCKFGAVYQYSNESLIRLVEQSGLPIAETQPITMDKYIWIMKKKVPTKMTPCGAVWIMITKES